MGLYPDTSFNPEKFYDSGVRIEAYKPVTDVYTPSDPVSTTSIYDVPSYTWDKKSRPNVDDYTRPWSKKASETMYSWAFTDYRKKHNAEITYAKIG